MSLSLAEFLRRAAAERAALSARRRLAATPEDAVTPELADSLGRSAVARPEGVLVWVHLAPGSDPRGIRSLLAVLRQEHRSLSCLVTCEDRRVSAGEGEILLTPPIDTPVIVQRFLSHWRPDIALWIGGEARPVLERAVRERGVPMGLLDFDPRSLQGRTKGAVLRRLQSFRFILAAAPVPPLLEAALKDRFERVGRLRPLQHPLPCNEGEREHFASLLLSRPVWLAAGLRTQELEAVCTAHRIASHLSHRLLLIILPESPEDGPEMRDRITAEGWRCALRSADEEPRDDTAIYVADTQGEDGLWYRIAPITFLGATLAGPGGGSDPGAPAALGSAVLHGPFTEAHAEGYERLHRARAAWRVRDGADLGQVVERLSSPEKVARMAHAAWTVTTDGAEAFNRAHELIEGLIDEVAR